jgi:dihydrolipoamide dehydrogenase
MAEIAAKVLVVGGGPGGYVSAIRAGQLGLDVVLVEQGGLDGGLGGTCLNVGCIPSKALIHAADAYERAAEQAKSAPFGLRVEHPTIDFARTIEWKNGIVGRLTSGVGALLKRHRVKILQGRAVMVDGKTCRVETDTGPQAVSAEHVVLATGSVPTTLPALPFGGRVISSTEALSLSAIPERLAVVGAGYIGLELGIAFRKLGCDVTVVEALDRILPLYDAPLVQPVAKWLEKHGVTVHLGAKAKGPGAHGLAVELKDGSTIDIACDNILVTVGRRPATDGWGLQSMAVDMSGRFVKVDDQCRTSMKNVWAIGDLVGEPMLEHKAAKQGEMVAEIIAGHKRRFDPVAIAAVCFTEPEIVSAGSGPADVSGDDTITAMFPFMANGRALSMDSGDNGGFVRVIARKSDHKVLGIQAVGAHVSELANEFALALEMGAVLEDIAGTIHVHPTLGEAFHESALRALGHAIHI